MKQPQAKQKAPMPAGILLWVLATIIMISIALTWTLPYIVYPLGIVSMLIPLFFITCLVFALIRRFRLFIGISQLVIGLIAFIGSLIITIGWSACGYSCGEGFGVALIILFIIPPSVLSIAFGLYLLLSKKATAYFGK